MNGEKLPWPPRIDKEQAMYVGTGALVLVILILLLLFLFGVI